MLMFMMMFLVLMPVLISIAFITLLERKILGLSQNRKGPNKSGFLGILQPISDAIKLFMKNIFFLGSNNNMFFFISPILGILISLMLWHLVSIKENIINMDFSLLFLLLFLSFNIYPMLLSGWSSNSSYSYLGSMRGVAQVISYEVILILIFLVLMLNSKDFNLIKLLKFNEFIYFFLLFPLLLFIWLFSCLAETNRTPFDFSEGESELVSGFNTEYMSGLFALIFMAEYSNIMFLSLVTSVVLFWGMFYWLVLLMLVFCFFWILVRSTYIRHRFDKLMMICWKSLMPLIIMFIIIMMFISLV